MYKILLFNIQYLLGLDGTVKNFLLRGYRYLFCLKRTRMRNLEKLIELVRREDPDLCVFIEMETGWLFDRVREELADYKTADVDCKYGEKSILRKLPITKIRGNAFFSKKKVHKSNFH